MSDDFLDVLKYATEHIFFVPKLPTFDDYIKAHPEYKNTTWISTKESKMTIKELQQALLNDKRFYLHTNSYQHILSYDSTSVGGFIITQPDGQVRSVSNVDWARDWQPLEEKPWEPKFLEPVLVRDIEIGLWAYGEFTHKHKDFFCVNGGALYKQCIPYNGNEHLLGKTS